MTYILAPHGDPRKTRGFALAVVCLFAALPVAARGQGSGTPGSAAYAGGTSEAVITSSGAIVAAIDSKEVNHEYLNDGTSLAEDRVSCKARPAGPYYLLVAGIARASDGFDALREAAGWYRDGVSLDDYSREISARMPGRLAPILNSVYAANRTAFDRSFAGHDALELTLLGAEHGRPRAVVVRFRAALAISGSVTVATEHSSCPGDCGDANSVYLLGLHDEAGGLLHLHPEIAGDTRTSRALQLVATEYESHPEAVGGPVSVVRVTGGGVVLEQPGACDGEASLPWIVSELNGAIAASANVVVHEDVAQYSQRGKKLRSAEIHGTVRVVAGNEEYAWDGAGAGFSAGHLPKPWCGGELATMLRALLQMLQQGRGTLSTEGSATEQTEPALVLAFHAAASDRYWQLALGSRTYPLAFDGRAWFSRSTGKLLRICWEAIDPRVPGGAGIARLEWDETFGISDIAGQPFLTPRSALYRVSYVSKADRTDWTETRFSDFRRYGATENVQFEGALLPYSARR